MTRLWYGVDPQEMCDQHLLGEHSEMHQEVGTFKRHPHGEAVVRGHVDKLQVIPRLIRHRHDRLAHAMLERGFNHESPLEDFDADAMPQPDEYAPMLLAEDTRADLVARCPDCRERMETADA